MNLKKILIVAAIALVAYFIISNPAGAGSSVNGGLDNLGDAADSITQFGTNVFGGQ